MERFNSYNPVGYVIYYTNYKMKKVIASALIILSISFFLGGCTALQPFPITARSGDTTVLAIGPVDGATRFNTRAYFTPDSDMSQVIDITTGVRAVFNIYADRTSSVYSTQTAYVDTNFEFLHHEAWETLVILDLPRGLPVGTGKISFAVTFPQPQYQLDGGVLGLYPDLNALSIPMEILPGVGTPSRFKYATTSGGALVGNLRKLMPQLQALVKPPVVDTGSAWGSTYGGIEFSMNLPMVDNSGTLTEDSIRIVAQDVTTFTKSKAQMTWVFDGTELKVIFISASGNLQYYEPRFSIIAETADFTATPVINSVRYFDIDGFEIIGPGITDYAVSVFGENP